MSQLVRLLPHQSRFVQSPYVFDLIRFFILCGGYACGKTSSLVYSVMNTVKNLLGKTDTEGHNPKLLVCSKNITFLSKTWTNAFVENLEKTGSQYSYDKARNIIVVGNVEIFLVGLEDPSTIYGYSVFACWCDELDELPTAVAMEAVKSVNDRVRQRVEGMRDPFVCFATTSQGLKGLYQTVIHFKKSGIGYVLMRARTRDNTFLPEDYVRNMYAIYNEKERRCLLEGEFISIDSGLVFPDYDPKKNLLDVDLFDTVQPDETVYIGQDFNSFGNAGVACVIRKGAVVIVKDYDIPDIRKAPSIFRYDFPLSRIVWIPDATYSAHFSEFKKELRQYDITIAYRKTNPLVQDRNFAINKLLFIERMFLCPIARNMEKAFLTHQKDPRTGQPTKGGVGAPDHWSDCLGYVAHYVLCWNRELKGLYDVTLGRVYEKRHARGADATELEVSTQLITADRLRNTRLEEAPNVNNGGDS